MEQPDRNSTNFPIWTYKRLKNLKFTKNDLELYHQYVVREFLKSTPDIRGVLVYHGTGYGKTRLGAMNIREFMHGRRVVVIAPTAVYSRFRDEFREIGIDTNNVNFISLKANNLATQIDRLEDSRIDDVLRSTPLDDTVLVVDEAHAFFNAVVNGSKNAVYMHDSIMSAKNIKILFQSATPIVNDPFELVPCFNLLAGQKLFPEIREDFYKYFVTKDNMHIHNADRFKNRIFGLVSYYGDWMTGAVRLHRPKRLPTEIIRVPMTQEQYAIYSTYRDKEREERAIGSRRETERYSAKSSSSSYRIRSRMASNLVPLDNYTDADILKSPKFARALDIVEDHKPSPGIFYSNFVNKCGGLAFARFLELNDWVAWDSEEPRKRHRSRKCFAVISADTNPEDRETIQKVSSLRENISGEIIRLCIIGPAGSEGIEFFNFRFRILCDPHFNAIREIQVESRIDRYRSHEMLPEDQRNVKTYILLADYPEAVQRERVALVARHKDKKGGGDDTRDVTDIADIMDIAEFVTGGDETEEVYGKPTHDDKDEAADEAEQAEAKTTAELREPGALLAEKKQSKRVNTLLEDTTDVFMYRQSKRRQLLALEFQRAMIEASVDCAVHRDNLNKDRASRINCMMCSPTSEPLFTDRIDNDMERKTNPCKNPETQKITAREIALTDPVSGEVKTFMYSKEDGTISVFEYSDQLDGYVPIKRNHPMYSDIVDHVNKK